MSEYTIHRDNLQQDAEILLKKHMHSNGLPFPEEYISWDSQFHKYNSLGGNKSPADWYIATQLSPDKFLCTYGTFRDGEKKFTFRSYDKYDFPEEKRALEDISNKVIIHEKLDTEKKIKDVRSLWEALDKNKEHPYLLNKKLPILNVRVKNDFLYIPFYDLENNLISLQKILPNKEKRFYSGISTKGLIHPIGDTITDDIFVAEGYATALSVHLATNAYSVVAGSASQLVPVGLMLLHKYPGKKIKLAADNGEAGQEAANKWKSSVSDYVHFPKNKDFNDDWIAFGKDKVRESFYSKVKSKSIFEVIKEDIKEDQKLNDVIFEASVAIIFGDAGVGKSRVVTEMAFCLAIQEKFLSFKAHKAARVLLIDGEMTDWDIQSRMKEMLERYKDYPNQINPDNFSILSNRSFRDQYDRDINLYDKSHREIIGNLFKDFDVLVLDNFNSLTDFSVDNESKDVIFKKKSDWRGLFSWLKDFRALGKTSIIVAHSTKDGATLQGVAEMKADATTVLKIRKPLQQPSGTAWKSQGEVLLDFVIEYSKARNIPQYLQQPIRALLISERRLAYGWKYDHLRPDSKE